LKEYSGKFKKEGWCRERDSNPHER